MTVRECIVIELRHSDYLEDHGPGNGSRLTVFVRSTTTHELTLNRMFGCSLASMFADLSIAWLFWFAVRWPLVGRQVCRLVGRVCDGFQDRLFSNDKPLWTACKSSTPKLCKYFCVVVTLVCPRIFER